MRVTSHSEHNMELAPIQDNVKSFLSYTLLVLAAIPFTLPAEPSLSEYIRPLVGTQGQGNTFPGPAAPFGMVQLSPDTADDLWDNAAGYKYSDTSIMGFSATHLSGTGIPDRGDFLFVPQIGEPKLIAGPTAVIARASRTTRNRLRPVTTRSPCSTTT